MTVWRQADSRNHTWGLKYEAFSVFNNRKGQLLSQICELWTAKSSFSSFDHSISLCQEWLSFFAFPPTMELRSSDWYWDNFRQERDNMLNKISSARILDCWQSLNAGTVTESRPLSLCYITWTEAVVEAFVNQADLRKSASGKIIGPTWRNPPPLQRISLETGAGI